MNHKQRNILLIIAILTILLSESAIFIYHRFVDHQHVVEVGDYAHSSPRHMMRDEETRIQLPHHHVYYLKTHKTGSTTMYAILAEYCRSHDLLPLLPRGDHFSQGGLVTKEQMLLVGNVNKYDMVFSHHIYTPLILNYLHNDSFRVTSLRDPYDNFVSAFWYYRNRWHRDYLVKVPSDDPVTEFLRHTEKYELANPRSSNTKNRQSCDLGFDGSKGTNNTEYIKQFIKLSDQRFDLVLIMEYFDEGLVMMKRTLHWNTEDIIYLTKNVGEYYKKQKVPSLELETERRKLHAIFSQPDIMLYDHFLSRFKKQMNGELGLEEEVSEFRSVLVKFTDFCNGLRSQADDTLVIPAGKWTKSFQITRVKCKMSTFDFEKLSKFIHNSQRFIFS